MEDRIEKSCWGVTLWAIGVVLVVALISSVLMSGDQSATVASTTLISN